MDHSEADLIDLNSEKNCRRFELDFTNEMQDEAMTKNENLMHNKRQQRQEDFYKEIATEILKYELAVLFGSTNTKTELHNY